MKKLRGLLKQGRSVAIVGFDGKRWLVDVERMFQWLEPDFELRMRTDYLKLRPRLFR